MLGKTVSTLQDDVVIADGKISGTLKYVDDYTGFSGDPDLQKGYYLALKFADSASADSKKVGLVPSSIGMGLVELDADMNGVFRITDPANQVFVTEITKDGSVQRRSYDLSGLVLEAEG